MNYSSIEPTIAAWAEEHGLHLIRSYRGSEVRSVDVVGPDGSRSQIWIDPPDGDGKVCVHAWDYENRRKDTVVAAPGLRQELESAYEVAIQWVGQV